MLASGTCSLIARDPRSMGITNYFLYIFMEVFYAFAIVCSVPAMHFTNKLKWDYFEVIDNRTLYEFNKAAISVLIILSFLIYIIPMIMKISSIANNIVPMFLYLLFGASCSTTNFNIAKIWNAPETSGGVNIEYRKSLCIIIHLLFNLFIGCLSFYNTNRKNKANCIMAFAIIFLVYSFFRTMAIILQLCNKEEFDTSNDRYLFDAVKSALENGVVNNEEQGKGNDNKENIRKSQNTDNNNSSYNDSRNEDNDGENNPQNEGGNQDSVQAP